MAVKYIPLLHVELDPGMQEWEQQFQLYPYPSKLYHLCNLLKGNNFDLGIHNSD